MKKRNMIIAVTAISVLAVTVAALPLISAGRQSLTPSDIIEEENGSSGDGEEYVIEEYVGEFDGFSDEQIAQVEKFREENPAWAGNYWWQEKVILGVVNEDSPRLDLETARAIIAANTEISDIIAEIEKVQAYPDYAGGSGSSYSEYWFDETGETKILVYPDWGGTVYLCYPGLEEYEELFSGFEAWKSSLG